MGHEVVVATSWLPERVSSMTNGVTIKEFKISGNMVRGYEGDTSEYQDFLREEKFDVVMNYAAQQWATDLFIEIIDEIKGAKIFVPCGFSGLKDPAYAEYFKQMPIWLKRYDKTIYLSGTYQDAVFAKDHGVRNMVIIPNGADEREFMGAGQGDIKKILGIKGEKMIMHLGSFTGIKGQQEAFEIYRSAAIHDSTLLMVGNVISRKAYLKVKLRSLLYNIGPRNIKANRQIVIMSLPRQQTVDAFRAADIFLFPSNTEASPLVLFESCAAKTPFLTTDVGNAEEIIEWTGGGRMLPTTKDASGLSHAKIIGSAKILTELCHDKQARDKLAKAGYESWRKNYSWDKIIGRYVDLYVNLLHEQNSKRH